MTARTERPPDLVYWLDDTLYLNITNDCTNDCYFCLRRFRSGIAGSNLVLDRKPSSSEIIKKVQEAVHRRSWREVVFCGFGEPTTRLETLLEVSDWISRNSPQPLRLDTNGQAFLLYPGRDILGELRRVGVNRLSVSLNAYDRSVYNEVCRPKFENAFDKVLEFIRRSRDSGFDVEITAVTIPEIAISKMERMAALLRVRFRARPYSPQVR